VDSPLEGALREHIIGWVLERAEANGGFVYRDELLGFHYKGERLPVIDFSRGIRNPAHFESTLAIVSSVGGPYDDVESDDGLLHYAYRSGDPLGGDNRKLRRAYETGAPLVFFRKELPNIYTPVAPVYVVEDYPEERSFIIAFDEAFRYFSDLRELTAPQREYAHRLAKQRLHQPAFRTRVLAAYRTHCAVCRLHRGSLLDAAHILPDSESGAPTVDNGLSLCKIHHSAYDQNMLGVSPDYRVHIAADLLAEKDGPMLRHGLQEMDGSHLTLPKRRRDAPNRDNLAWRFDRFRQTAGL